MFVYQIMRRSFSQLFDFPRLGDEPDRHEKRLLTSNLGSDYFVHMFDWRTMPVV